LDQLVAALDYDFPFQDVGRLVLVVVNMGGPPSVPGASGCSTTTNHPQYPC
jgi:hypothetical protein